MGKISYSTLKEREDAAAAEAIVELAPDEEQRRLRQLVTDWAQSREAKTAREETVSHTGRGQVHRWKVIDPHENRLRTITPIGWVNLTPSMCTADPQCSYDAAEECGFPSGYDSIPEDMILPWTESQRTVRQHAEIVLARHKALKHSTTGPAHIRTPEQVREAAQRKLPETFIENPRL